MVVQLKVNTPRADDVLVDVCENEEELEKTSVEELTEIICKQLGLVGKVRIVYEGKTLEDSKTLGYYKISPMSKIHTVLMLPGGF